MSDKDLIKLIREIRYLPGKLRIVHVEDLELLVRFAIKNSEITIGRAAEIMGLSHEEMDHIARKWYAEDTNVPSET